MQQDTYFYDPAGDHGLAHDPFKAIVAPRVIGWISSCNENGQPNLAPYSFFGMFAANPKVIAFSSEGYKDTIRNIEKTGEFTWNFTSASLAQAMNKCSAPVDASVNEFELAGLTPVPGVRVKTPRVGESPAALECKLLQVFQLKDLNGQPMPNWMALGQVVGVHIQPAYLVNGMFDLHAAQPVLRAGYRGDYAEIGHMFEMIRPSA